MTAVYLRGAMEIDFIRKVVTLPKLALLDFTARSPLTEFPTATTAAAGGATGASPASGRGAAAGVGNSTAAAESAPETGTGVAGGQHGQLVPTATPQDCLRGLAQYLSPEDRSILMRMLAEGVQFTVRFRQPSSRCLRFGPYDSSALGSALTPNAQAGAGTSSAKM